MWGRDVTWSSLWASSDLAAWARCQIPGVRWGVDLEIRTIATDEAVAVLGPIVIRVIVGAPTDVACLDRLHLITQELLQRWPVAGMWIVVHHGSPIPDGETRRHAGQIFSPYAERLAIGYALLGLGFWSGAAIAVTRVLARLMRQPTLIDTSVEASAQRMAMEVVGLDPSEFVAVHERLLDDIHRARAMAS